MPSFKEKYGEWAIVAGAAEGLGEAWSVSLAKRKLNLLMVDNQSKPLQNLAETIKNEYGVETKTLELDLAEKDATGKIMETAGNLDAGLLVYNAAFSLIKPFVELSPEELTPFIDVNVSTQLKLVHAFSKRLTEKKRGGGILLMSSLAGLIGMQLVTPYAATKAFAWNLAEALHYELKPKNIDVMACVAGATATPAYIRTNPQYGFFKPAVMKPAEVTEAVLKKFGKKTLYIPGFSNRMNYFILTRLLPRKTAATIANRTMKKMYP